MKFKVGDRVIVIKTRYFSVQEGDVGIVQQISQNQKGYSVFFKGKFPFSLYFKAEDIKMFYDLTKKVDLISI